MAGSKESGLALTPLLARSSSRNDTDGSAASPSVPSISFLPARSSSKNLQGLERESTENATVSLHQVGKKQPPSLSRDLFTEGSFHTTLPFCLRLDAFRGQGRDEV